MSRFPKQGDPTLGSFTRYIEETAMNVRYNYVHRQEWLQSKESLVPEPIERLIEPCLNRFTLTLEEVAGNDTLYTAILRLSDMEKKVLLLSIIEDRPMAEVKELLHISSARAYRLRKTALAKLRAAMERENET